MKVLMSTYMLLCFFSSAAVVFKHFENVLGPGWVAQLVGALFWYAKVVSSIPSEGT